MSLIFVRSFFNFFTQPVLILFFIFNSIIQAAEPQKSIAVKKSIIKKELVKPSINPRINNFLQDILQATSFDEVGNKYEGYGFNKKEAQIIKQLISGKKYSKKLNTLEMQEKKSAANTLKRQSSKQAKLKMNNALKARQKKILEMNRLDMKMGRRSESTAKITGKISTPSTPKEPKINTLSSQVIRPGRYVLIVGDNFGPLKGRVSVRIGTKVYRGIITHWANDLVAFNIDPKITGLLSSDAFLTLTKVTKQQVKWGLRFVPSFDEHHISHWWNLLVPFPKIWPVKRRFSGCDCKLENEWKVAEFWLDKRKHRNASCEYINPPDIGSISPKVELLLKARGFSSIHCTHNVIVRGPKGTRPYSGNCC